MGKEARIGELHPSSALARMCPMDEGVIVTMTSPGGVPIWVTILQFLSLAILAGFIFLACYAGWKVFRWLRRWSP